MFTAAAILQISLALKKNTVLHSERVESGAHKLHLISVSISACAKMKKKGELGSWKNQSGIQFWSCGTEDAIVARSQCEMRLIP